MSFGALRRVCGELDARVDLALRWRGGDLDRLLNARHSALHETFARTAGSTPGWVFVPEVSFAIYREHGVIDVLGWHATSRSLLVVELKTELVDLQEHLGTLDRKVRLAPRVAADRGWRVTNVGAWLVVAPGRMNRRRIAAHSALLRSALPAGGGEVAAWLREPSGPLRALSQVPNAHEEVLSLRMAARKRVRRRATTPNTVHPSGAAVHGRTCSAGASLARRQTRG